MYSILILARRPCLILSHPRSAWPAWFVWTNTPLMGLPCSCVPTPSEPYRKQFPRRMRTKVIVALLLNLISLCVCHRALRPSRAARGCRRYIRWHVLRAMRNIVVSIILPGYAAEEKRHEAEHWVSTGRECNSQRHGSHHEHEIAGRFACLPCRVTTARSATQQFVFNASCCPT
jgi:hypothetical protein